MMWRTLWSFAQLEFLDDTASPTKNSKNISRNRFFTLLQSERIFLEIMDMCSTNLLDHLESKILFVIHPIHRMKQHHTKINSITPDLKYHKKIRFTKHQTRDNWFLEIMYNHESLSSCVD
jgi:hypothetical protein